MAQDKIEPPMTKDEMRMMHKSLSGVSSYLAQFFKEYVSRTNQTNAIVRETEFKNRKRVEKIDDNLQNLDKKIKQEFEKTNTDQKKVIQKIEDIEITNVKGIEDKVDKLQDKLNNYKPSDVQSPSISEGKNTIDFDIDSMVEKMTSSNKTLLASVLVNKNKSTIKKELKTSFENVIDKITNVIGSINIPNPVKQDDGVLSGFSDRLINKFDLLLERFGESSSNIKELLLLNNRKNDPEIIIENKYDLTPVMDIVKSISIPNSRLIGVGGDISSQMNPPSDAFNYIDTRLKQLHESLVSNISNYINISNRLLENNLSNLIRSIGSDISIDVNSNVDKETQDGELKNQSMFTKLSNTFKKKFSFFSAEDDKDDKEAKVDRNKKNKGILDKLSTMSKGILGKAKDKITEGGISGFFGKMLKIGLGALVLYKFKDQIISSLTKVFEMIPWDKVMSGIKTIATGAVTVLKDIMTVIPWKEIFSFAGGMLGAVVDGTWELISHAVSMIDWGALLMGSLTGIVSGLGAILSDPTNIVKYLAIGGLATVLAPLLFGRLGSLLISTPLKFLGNSIFKLTSFISSSILKTMFGKDFNFSAKLKGSFSSILDKMDIGGKIKGIFSKLDPRPLVKGLFSNMDMGGTLKGMFSKLDPRPLVKTGVSGAVGGIKNIASKPINAITSVIPKVIPKGGKVLTSTLSLLSKVSKPLTGLLTKIPFLGWAISAITGIYGAWTKVFGEDNKDMSFGEKIFTFVKESIGQTISNMLNIPNMIGGIFSLIFGDDNPITKFFNTLGKYFDATIMGALDFIIAPIKFLVEKTFAGFMTAWDVLKSMGGIVYDLFTGNWQGIGQHFMDIFTSIKSFLYDTIFDLILIIPRSFRKMLEGYTGGGWIAEKIFGDNFKTDDSNSDNDLKQSITNVASKVVNSETLTSLLSDNPAINQALEKRKSLRQELDTSDKELQKLKDEMKIAKEEKDNLKIDTTDRRVINSKKRHAENKISLLQQKADDLNNRRKEIADEIKKGDELGLDKLEGKITNIENQVDPEKKEKRNIMLEMATKFARQITDPLLDQANEISKKTPEEIFSRFIIKPETGTVTPNHEKVGSETKTQEGTLSNIGEPVSSVENVITATAKAEKEREMNSIIMNSVSTMMLGTTIPQKQSPKIPEANVKNTVTPVEKKEEFKEPTIEEIMASANKEESPSFNNTKDLDRIILNNMIENFSALSSQLNAVNANVSKSIAAFGGEANMPHHDIRNEMSVFNI